MTINKLCLGNLKYLANHYEKALGRIMFPSHKRCCTVNKAYNDLFKNWLKCLVGLYLENCENRNCKQ